ncbi:hypothetical protein I6A60_01590 [Frankia sp. AgB1.9]|uniref:hypothetical protein n=1 Tax=unclassified Frankia TaxID=2632575 RepID=UPI0019329082|nr:MULTISPECIES: hypothetical protein [unclassified Frankia]MBL7546579.1 hypothetical protein [Frankia sp. AgB1.9]
MPVLPLTTLQKSFALLVAGPEPLALDGGLVPGLPDRLVALDELRDRLLAASCPPAVRDTAWAIVIRRSRLRDAAWTVGAAGMALPALRAITASLDAHGPLDPADIEAEVLTGFLTALATIRLDLPRIAVRLRWAAYRAGLRLVTQTPQIPYPDEDLFDAQAIAPSPARGPRDVLAVAVRAGVLTETEADLITATRLGAVSLPAWAAGHATKERTAYRRREQAEQRLAVALTPTRGGRVPDPSAPGRDAATGRQETATERAPA